MLLGLRLERRAIDLVTSLFLLLAFENMFEIMDRDLISVFLQNRRPDYISIFMENLVSWDAVSARYEAAKAVAADREKETAQN